MSSELIAEARAEMREVLSDWRLVIADSFGSRVALTRLETSEDVSIPDPAPSAVKMLLPTEVIGRPFKRVERR